MVENVRTNNMVTPCQKKLPASFFPSQKSIIDTQNMVPVLAPAPPATAAPTTRETNKRVHPKRERTPRKKYLSTSCYNWQFFVFRFADDVRDTYEKNADEIPAEGNC